MRLNYKKILREADASNACARPLRAFAYFVENKKYKQARELIVYHEAWLYKAGILADELSECSEWVLERKFNVRKQVTYNYNGTVRMVYKAKKDGSNPHRQDIADDLNENHPEYRIPEDYIYKTTNGRVLRNDPS